MGGLGFLVDLIMIVLGISYLDLSSKQKKMQEKIDLLEKRLDILTVEKNEVDLPFPDIEDEGLFKGFDDE